MWRVLPAAMLASSVAGGMCGPRSVNTANGTEQQAPSATAGTSDSAIAFQHVTLIDGTGRRPQPGMTVVVQAGRITEIYRSASKPLRRGVARPDYSGHYLMPGLIDSHVHLGTRERPPGVAEALLKNAFMDGVTSVRDMGGSMAIVAPLARTASSDMMPMPRMYYSAIIAGPLEARWFHGASGVFMAGGVEPGTSPLVQRVVRGADVSAMIARAKAAGATGIKFYGDVEPAMIRSLVAEARRQGLRTWSHLAMPPGRPRDAVDAGVEVVTHGDQFRAEMTQPVTAGLSDSLRRHALQEQHARMLPSDTAMTRLLELMRRRGTMFDPTLFVMLPLSPPADTSKRNMDRVLMPFRFAAAMTARAARMGIPVVAGTDALGGSTANLHAELQLLVDSAGLTPLEAITAATLHGARALGAQDSLGSVAVGKRADLLILRADPARDIRNTQTVVAVVKGGRVHVRTTPRRPGPLAAPPRP